MKQVEQQNNKPNTLILDRYDEYTFIASVIGERVNLLPFGPRNLNEISDKKIIKEAKKQKIDLIISDIFLRNEDFKPIQQDEMYSSIRIVRNILADSPKTRVVFNTDIDGFPSNVDMRSIFYQLPGVQPEWLFMYKLSRMSKPEDIVMPCPRHSLNPCNINYNLRSPSCTAYGCQTQRILQYARSETQVRHN